LTRTTFLLSLALTRATLSGTIFARPSIYLVKAMTSCAKGFGSVTRRWVIGVAPMQFRMLGLTQQSQMGRVTTLFVPASMVQLKKSWDRAVVKLPQQLVCSFIAKSPVTSAIQTGLPEPA
jgi:hypothetical protein